MSKLARSDFSSTGRARRVLAGLTAGAAIAMALAVAQGPRDSAPARTARPSRKVDASGRVTRQAMSVLPDGAARSFASSYVSFLYGRLAAGGVAPIDLGLRHQLLAARSTATPAELARALVVRDLTVGPGTKGTAMASAVVDDGASPPYALSFNLTLSHGRWLVTSVQRGDR